MTKHDALSSKKSVWAWALYDWANSSFWTTVSAGFFPIFFKQYWSAGVDPTVSTAKLGLANAAGSFVLGMLSPWLGAASDKGGLKKKLCFAFTLLGVLATLGLYFVEKGAWFYAALFYTLGMIGLGGATVFYEALLPAVASPRDVDRVSALGYSLGYLGGGLLFAVNVLMFQKPELFGIADGATAVRMSFLTVAVWWALFSIPLFVVVREPKGTGAAGANPWREGFSQLLSTLRELPRLRNIFYFLIAYWFYQDGVSTVIKMAVDYGLSIGLESKDLIQALLITQFVGFPAALLFGWLGSRWSARGGILVAIVVYIGITVMASQLTTGRGFLVMAIIVGLVQGGIQALSRSFYARLVP